MKRSVISVGKYDYSQARAGGNRPARPNDDDHREGARWRFKSGIRSIARAFKNEHGAFLFACLFLVMEYSKLQHIYPVIDVIPWGPVTMLLPLFLAYWDRHSHLPPRAAVIPVAAFSVCVALSIMFAFLPSESIDNWQRIVSPMLMVLMLTSILRTRQRIFLFIVIYFLVNLKMAQHGFLTWSMRGFSYSGWGVTGSPVWFQNSGEFAMEMAVFLPIVLALMAAFHRDWSRPVRWGFYVVVVMTIGSIIACGSRGGLLGLGAVGFWLLLYSRRRLHAFAVVAVLSIIVVAVMPQALKDRFAEVGDDRTSVSRMIYWEYARDTVEQHPLTGIGFANWSAYADYHYPELSRPLYAGIRLGVVHNTFLEAAVGLGWFGATVYILILLQIFVTNLRSSRLAEQKGDRFLAAVAQGTNGGLLTFLITSFFMSVLYYPVVWMMLVFTVCIAVVLRSPDPSAGASSHDPAPRAT